MIQQYITNNINNIKNTLLLSFVLFSNNFLNIIRRHDIILNR